MGVISIFDTSFVDCKAVTTFDDCIAFYRDINLLAALTNHHYIVKPSKDKSYFVDPKQTWSSPKGEKIIILWDILQTLTNVQWLDSSHDTTSVIMASDMVITHCMSSPTGEALGLRKRAFWYESGDKHRGIIYDHIPGLIAHGFRELVHRLFELEKTTDAEYSKYLSEHIMGHIDPYLDGRAIDRVQNLIGGNHDLPA